MLFLSNLVVNTPGRRYCEYKKKQIPLDERGAHKEQIHEQKYRVARDGEYPVSDQLSGAVVIDPNPP